MDIIGLLLQTIGIIFLAGVLLMVLGLVAFSVLIMVEEFTDHIKKKGGKKK